MNEICRVPTHFKKNSHVGFYREFVLGISKMLRFEKRNESQILYENYFNREGRKNHHGYTIFQVTSKISAQHQKKNTNNSN